METIVTLKDVKDLIQHFSWRDKVHLIEWIAPQIERDLQTIQPTPRKSLRGLWRGLDLTGEEIDEARQEMWATSPREDI